MSIKHEEAVRLPESFWQWLKDNSHKRDDGYWLYVSTNDAREQLAALIADVRRELPAELFDSYAVLKAIPAKECVSAAHVCAVLDAVVKLIRARLEEGK